MVRREGGETIRIPVRYGEEAREDLTRNGEGKEDGGCVAHRRVDIAGYGELKLLQKNKPYRNAKSNSSCPYSHKAEIAPSRSLGVRVSRFCIWVFVS